MKIILSGELSEPPSSINCFRDVTLYASCFLKADILVECEKGTRDMYYKWLKDHGAFDFIDGMIREGEERGFRIGPRRRSNFLIDRVTAHNLNVIVRRLNELRSFPDIPDVLR